MHKILLANDNYHDFMSNYDVADETNCRTTVKSTQSPRDQQCGARTVRACHSRQPIIGPVTSAGRKVTMTLEPTTQP